MRRPAYRLASFVSILSECVGKRGELEERRGDGGEKQREKDEIEEGRAGKAGEARRKLKKAEND